ncbi:hypothetical protein HYU07_04545 [Candidatus Woesearchaeota archaeon]|nr:hypothetical protein [Candidatus Woesearchaeota archaeon]
MTLESMLKPVECLDRTIQKQYTKLGHKLEKKLPKRILGLLKLIGTAYGGGCIAEIGTNLFGISNELNLGLSYNLTMNIEGLYNASEVFFWKKDRNIVSESTPIDPVDTFYKSYN